MSSNSTITLTKKTKGLLLKNKNYPSETYEEIILRLLKLVENLDEDLDEKELQRIEESIQQIRKGKYKSQEEMEQKYGL